MDQKIKTISVKGQKYSVTQIVGMWFFRMDGNDTGWTGCSEGFVKLIENEKTP